jgi:hypothetical protein
VTTSPISNPAATYHSTSSPGVWDSGDWHPRLMILLDNFTFDVSASETTTAPVEVPK